MNKEIKRKKANGDKFFEKSFMDLNRLIVNRHYFKSLNHDNSFVLNFTYFMPSHKARARKIMTRRRKCIHFKINIKYYTTRHGSNNTLSYTPTEQFSFASFFLHTDAPRTIKVNDINL